MSRARDAMLVEQLRQKDEDLRTAREALHTAQVEIKLLRQKLDALARRMFGRSSEKLDAAQMQLLLEGLEEITDAQATAQLADMAAAQAQDADVKAAPVRERGPRVPAHLPVREIIMDPEEVKMNPEDADKAAASLLSFSEKVDQAKAGAPVALGVITTTGFAYRRDDGVSVLPIGAMGP